MNNNENRKGKYHVGFMLRDVFGFAEYQEKTINGLGYKIPIGKNSDNSILNKGDATVIGKFQNSSF